VSIPHQAHLFTEKK